MITSVKKINKCSLRHCRLFLQKKLGRGSPFNVSYQNFCKKTYVNDSQNFVFPTSHFVIELLPFDYLSNQKLWVNKKMHFKRSNFIPLFSIFSLVAILVGSQDHRTQFWKGAIQGLFHKSLIAIGPVVSEKIFMWISHRVLC